MDKDTTKSTFNEVLNQFPYEKFRSLIKDTGADRYIKKLFTTKLLYIMFIAQIAQIESIRALADRVHIIDASTITLCLKSRWTALT